MNSNAKWMAVCAAGASLILSGLPPSSASAADIVPLGAIPPAQGNNFGNPYAFGGIIFGKKNVIYGTTLQPGGFGAVYEMPVGGSPTILHTFTGAPADGANSNAALVMDKKGALYGTTVNGGTFDFPGVPASGAGGGTIFKLTPPKSGQTAWGYQVIYNFCGQASCADGYQPYGSLILDSAGNLYGTTSGGGPNFPTGGIGGGTVFKLSPPTPTNPNWSETVLYGFSGGNDGGSPQAALVFDKNGILYGTTTVGGSGYYNNAYHGVAFQLVPTEGGAWTETVLWNFCSQTDCIDGANPATPLVIDKAGALYGTTKTGGGTQSAQSGVVFQLSPPVGGGSQWTETPIWTFCAAGGTCNDGMAPYAGLEVIPSGVLYGTTSGGSFPTGGTLPPGSPTNFGTVFKLVKNKRTGKWAETIMFDSFLGSLPSTYPGISVYHPNQGTLVLKSGWLYGATFGAIVYTSQFSVTGYGGGVYKLHP